MSFKYFNIAIVILAFCVVLHFAHAEIENTMRDPQFRAQMEAYTQSRVCGKYENGARPDRRDRLSCQDGGAKGKAWSHAVKDYCLSSINP
jgi:hypothetical protein